MRVAIVSDWLVTYAGAERCLEQILKCFPEADLFAVVDFIPKGKRDWLMNKKVRTSFIQKIPFAKKKYRSLLPLMPMAISRLNLSQYDIVISSSHAVAKGVKTRKNQLHVCYIHSPMRYAWDLREQYLKESGLDKGFKKLVVNGLLNKLKKWDLKNADDVTYFVANSQYISERVKRCYNQDSTVIYPPVAVQDFPLQAPKEGFYFTASRMVPYKKIDLIVEAFAKMPDKKLIVIGDGPDFKKIQSRQADNIKLIGYQPFSILKDHMQRAKAFVFAAEEDFGIVPVEAQACGTPVIAFGKGGALETVVNLGKPNPTGLFFQEQTVDSLVSAVKLFDESIAQFTPENCRKNSERFSQDHFRKQFSDFVQNAWNTWQK